MKYLLGCLTLCLGACASPAPPEPIIQTVEVRVPVPVSCVPDDFDREPPDYPDMDAALIGAEDAAERYNLLWAGRGVRQAREVELMGVLEGCR